MMAKRAWKMSTKIFLLMFVIALIMLISLSFIVINHSSNIIKEDALAYNDRVTAELSKNIYQYFNNIENKLYGIYTYEEELFQLKKYANVQPYSSAMLGLAEDFFIQRLSDIHEIMAVYILGYDNKCISSYFTSKQDQQLDFTIDNQMIKYSGSLREYWINTDNNVYIHTYTKGLESVIRMGIKIYDVVTGQYYGAIIIEMNGQKLDRLINEYKIYEDQVFYLVNGHKELLYPYQLRNKEAQTQYAQFSGYKTKAIIEKYNIELVTLFSINSVNKNITSSVRIVILVVVILLAVAILLSFFLSNLITRPLEILTKKMKQVEKGDISTRVVLSNNDEISELADGFNSMVREIDELINQEYRLKLAMHETKLKALQAQVNPHFLYNTLQAMGSIARKAKSEMLQNMCKALSDIFRYSISMKETYATIKDELTHVYNYVYIQNVRFNNKINLTVHCKTDLYDCVVPRLTLQPIVENAIEHGLLMVKTKKLLRISIFQRQDQLIVYVADNGCGMTEEVLRKKQQAVQVNEGVSLKQSKSIGLTNVKERLKLVFGENASIKLYSKLNKGSMVLLTIKLTRKEDIV